MDNTTRADLAAEALKAYMAIHPDYKRDMEITNSAIIDLAADLLHLAKRYDESPEAINRLALIHFEEEAE